MERVVKFLKDAETYYLATVDGDQQRVRPFGTAHIFEGRDLIPSDNMQETLLQKGKPRQLSRMMESRLRPRGIRYLLLNMRLQLVVGSAYGSGIKCNPARN